MSQLLKFPSLVVLLSISALGLSSASGSEPTDHCWLLSSPMRHYLSSGGEFALQYLCDITDESWPHAEQKRESPLRADTSLLNVRVNDPSTDIPEHTTQSETTIAIFGNAVLVGYVDTGQFNPRTNGVSTLSGYARSLDGGQTFTDMGRGPANEQGWGFSDPDIDVDSQGNFYFANIQFTPSTLGQNSFMGIAKSTDGGATFSEPLVLSTATFGPQVTITTVQSTRDATASSRCGRQALKGNIRTLELPAIAVDRSEGPTRGNVYVVYQGDPDGDGVDALCGRNL